MQQKLYVVPNYLSIDAITWSTLHTINSTLHASFRTLSHTLHILGSLVHCIERIDSKMNIQEDIDMHTIVPSRIYHLLTHPNPDI